MQMHLSYTYADIYVLLCAAGGGKSLTFQLPCLTRAHGFTVVRQ